MTKPKYDISDLPMVPTNFNLSDVIYRYVKKRTVYTVEFKFYRLPTCGGATRKLECDQCGPDCSCEVGVGVSILKNGKLWYSWDIVCSDETADWPNYFPSQKNAEMLLSTALVDNGVFVVN